MESLAAELEAAEASNVLPALCFVYSRTADRSRNSSVVLHSPAAPTKV